MLLILAVAVRIASPANYVYNDEVGGGYTGFGYLAWGYFDTAHMYAGYFGHLDFLSVYTWSYSTGSLTPVTPLLAAVSIDTLRFVPPLEAARLPVTLMSSLTSPLIALIGWGIFKSRKVALLAGLVFALDPIAVLSGRILYEDAASVFFGCLAFCFLLAAANGRSATLFSILAGASTALSLASKEFGILFLSAILLGNLRWDRLLGRQSGQPTSDRNLLLLPWKYTRLLLLTVFLVIVLAFPWELPALAERTHLLASHTIIGSPTTVAFFYKGQVVTHAIPFFYTSSLVVTIVDPWILVFSALGMPAIISSYRTRLKSKDAALGQNLLLFYSISCVALFSLLQPIYPHYLLFLLWPLILASSVGAWAVLEVISKQTESGSWSSGLSAPGTVPSSSITRTRLRVGVRWTACLVIVALAAVPIISNFEYPGLYYSPLAGGLPGASKEIQIEANEATGPASSYLQSTFPAGSTILVFGQPQLFAYLLPSDRILGPNQVYSQYLHAPAAFLKLSNISAVVVEYVAYQIYPTDPMVQFLRSTDASWHWSYDNVVLVSVFDAATIPGPELLLNESAPFVSWTAHQGNLSSNGTLTVGPPYTYAWASTPVLNFSSGCDTLVALKVSSISSTVSAFRVEWAAANGSVVDRVYFDLTTGLLVGQISVDPAQSLTSVQLRFVVVGPSGAALTLSAVSVGCPS